MWKPPLNFVSLHYAYIISCSILSFLIIYAYGNVAAVDAFFFGCSANTESGLNTVDVKALKTGQQLVIYFFPIITNLGFVNIIVVVVRLHWFRKALKQISPSLLRPPAPVDEKSLSSSATAVQDLESQSNTLQPLQDPKSATVTSDVSAIPKEHKIGPQSATPNITWASNIHDGSKEKALRVPRPQSRDRGRDFDELDVYASDEEDINIRGSSSQQGPTLRRRLSRSGASVSGMSIERIGASMFVIGDTGSRARSRRPSSIHSSVNNDHLARVPSHGSSFGKLTQEEKEKLGGIEYRSLNLLLKIVVGYFFGLQLFGAICLVGWIQYAPVQYIDYLESQGQNKIWWAFYSAQTMVNNLGFTLTPDSMITFADATFPLLVMTFLAYAGNTLYPVLLRLVIWTMHKLVPKTSSLQEPLQFLLEHPRRCYTLLFPSTTTWALFAIIFVLNFVDVLLIIILDLHNAAVNYLSPGPRILAALFQAASSRHTGTATFNLAEVSPAVQFSLLVMMYIAVFPIAFTIRVSNAYEDQTLGKYGADEEVEERNSSAYILSHIRNQLSFDLWYIFLGIFAITIAEADRIADNSIPAFTVFTVFFEVVSAYANVGLSLGYPTVNTSLSGEFGSFSKVIICFMMIRGRHRGLPYALDNAIVLPGQDLGNEDPSEDEKPETEGKKDGYKLKRYHTQ